PQVPRGTSASPGGLIPRRAPPKHPVSTSLTPVRPPPQPPVPTTAYAGAASRAPDAHAAQYGTPPIPETEALSSQPNANGGPRVQAGAITSPVQYQQQQEQAMAAAQQAIANKQLDRSRSKRQQGHQHQTSRDIKQAATTQPGLPAQVAAPPAARPRQR